MTLIKLCAPAIFIVFALVSAGSSERQSSEVHPIVAVKSGCLLGGSGPQGRWLKPEVIAPLLRGNEKYHFYTLRGASGTGNGARPESVGAPCEETMQINVTGATDEHVALGGEWNAMPRALKTISPTDPVYRQAVASILRSKGLKNAIVQIKQAFRVDLDGDGTDEVVIAATRYAGGLTADSKANDYSLVFVRKVIRGRVQTIILAGDFHAKAATFNAPSQYEISAIADFNNDGVMEILVYGEYYEGHWSTLYGINSSKAEELLTCGCGA